MKKILFLMSLLLGINVVAESVKDLKAEIEAQKKEIKKLQEENKKGDIESHELEKQLDQLIKDLVPINETFKKCDEERLLLVGQRDHMKELLK